MAAFTAIGFFGLDQVGVEFEGPFGVDDNDFPLLTMGLAMCNDLDAMVRTVSRTRMEACSPVRLDGEPPDPGRRRARPRVGRSCRKFMKVHDLPLLDVLSSPRIPAYLGPFFTGGNTARRRFIGG